VNNATGTVPTLALADGSKVTFELNTASTPTAPLLSVSTPDGLTASGAVHTLNVTNPQALNVGQFTLIDYDGTAITSGYTLGTLPARAAGTLVYNTANTSIDLNVTGVDSTLWNGTISADWDTGTAADVGGTKNFRLVSNSALTNFIVGDRSTFDDTAAGTTTVNLPAAVQPTSVTVDNSVKNYVFQGPGSITGATSLTKLGTGSLTITTDNTYTGLTTVTAGTLNLGNGGTTGSITGPVFVDGGGTLTFNRSNDSSYGGAITGTGIVTKSGAGTLTLLGSSQFTGTVSVDQGTMLLDDLGGGGDLFATSIVVNNGASFIFGEHGNVDFPDSTIVTVNTGGVFELRQGENFGGIDLKGGSFRMTGTALAGINATGAVNAGFTLESGSITTSFTGAATGGVLNGPGSINKITPGTVTVDSGVTFGTTATMNVREGVLAMPASSFPDGGTTTVTLGDSSTNGTIRVLDAGTGTSARQFDIAPGGGTIDVANAAGSVSLTGLLTGSGTLTKAGAGTLSVTGAADLTGPVAVTGGSLVVTGSLANSTGVTVTGGRFDAAAAQTVKALTVNGGQARVVSAAVKIALTVGDGTANSSQLSLTGGTLDLMTNGLAVHYAAGNGAAVLASVRAQLKAGYHPSAPNAGDGDWKGTTGITSSSIGSLNSVGYALAGEVLPFANGATTDTFLGTTVDQNTVVARYTLSGDLNLDGSVDFLDLAKLAQSYNVTDGTRQWTTGDINYDGNTDFLDLAKMAQNYNTALPSSPIPGASVEFQADLARAFASVPEPSSMLGVAGLSLLILRRRRWGRTL
jgi:autotransporter-associated beta strand protein